MRAGASKLPTAARREAARLAGRRLCSLRFPRKSAPRLITSLRTSCCRVSCARKSSMPGRSHLIVVPDGALHELPLELLPYEPERKTYLLDTFPPISYAPSLHIYRRLRDDSRFGDWDVALVSLADPSYRPMPAAGDANGAEGLSSAGQEFLHHWRGGFARLEGFKKESDAVCAAFQKAVPNPAASCPWLTRMLTKRI